MGARRTWRGLPVVALLWALVFAHRGGAVVSTTRLREGMRALREQEAVWMTGGEPSCGGLVSEMCKPCPDGGPDKFCAKVKEMCARIFCSPMCRRNTWKCEVKFGGLEEESKKEKQYSEALCGQFIAEGCASDLGCCADDEALFDYVENEGYLDDFPQPLYPTPSCLEGPTSDLCSKCKGAVQVKLTPSECPFPSPEGGDGKREEKTYNLAKDSAGKDFPGVNAHKGVQERCLKLEEKVKAKLSGMETKFKENACKCMGCCEGKCFRPLTETYKPGGIEKGY